MSTWGELFNDRLADAGYLAPAIDEAGDHVTLVDAPVGEVERIMREALLSDDAVERAARGCFDIRDDAYDDREWGELDSQERELYLCQARAALTAALGEEEE